MYKVKLESSDAGKERERRKRGIEGVQVKIPPRILVFNENGTICAVIAEWIGRNFPEAHIEIESSEPALWVSLAGKTFDLIVSDIYARKHPPNALPRLIAEQQPQAVQLVTTAHAFSSFRAEATQIRGVLRVVLIPFGDEFSTYVRQALEYKKSAS